VEEEEFKEIEVKPKKSRLPLVLAVFGIILVVFILYFAWRYFAVPSKPSVATIKDIYEKKMFDSYVTFSGTVVAADNRSAILEDNGYAIRIISLRVSARFQQFRFPVLEKNQRVVVSGIPYKSVQDYIGFAANSIEIIDSGYLITPPLEVDSSFVQISNYGRWVTLKNQTLINIFDRTHFDFGYTVWIPYLAPNVSIGSKYNLIGFISYYDEPQLIATNIEPSH
jgi:hypothetical protein